MLLARSARRRRLSLAFRHRHVCISRARCQGRGARGWSSRRSRICSWSLLCMMPSRPSCRAPLLVIETACWNSAALLHLCSALRRHSRSSTILRSWTACNRRSKPKSTSHRKSTAIRSEQLAEDEVTLRRILGCLRRRPAAIGNRGRGLQGGAPRATRHGTKGVVSPCHKSTVRTGN